MFIRLTALLCASLYGGMVIFGTEQSGTTVAGASQAGFTPVSSRSDISSSASPFAVSAAFAADAPQVDILAAIETAKAESDAEGPNFPAVPNTVFVVGADEKKPNGLIRITAADAPADMRRAKPDAAASGTDANANVVEVTGAVVNLRSGPSTNTSVVTRLKRGVRAEVVANNGDGWMKIRDLSSGAEGYMSGNFLSPVTSG